MFVDRVVYALTSPMGEVIGFGGRVIDPERPAEVQELARDAPLSRRARTCSACTSAKHAIREGGRALVVEGNFDVMTLHQRGVDYAVAPQGTAMTAAQVKLLKRFAREVVLMLDADPAGRAGDDEGRAPVRRGGAAVPHRAAARQGRQEAVDPDELARNDLPQLEALIENAQDAVEFFFEQVAVDVAHRRCRARWRRSRKCAPLLRTVRDPLARDLYCDKLATLLKVDAGLVQRALRAAPTRRAARATCSRRRRRARRRRADAPVAQRRIPLTH